MTQPVEWNIDGLAQIVRYAWIEWAKTQPNPKPSWLVPWEQLSDADKEADRYIARAVLRVVLVALSV